MDLCRGHISCDALRDKLATSFAYIPRRHTSRTAMALRWRWGIWASQEGIAGFNYSLKKFLASPMSNMQMRHREHVSKPSGGGSRRPGVALRRQACRCAIYLSPGEPRELQRRYGDVPITGRWSCNGLTMARRQHCDVHSIGWRLQCYPPAIARCQQPPLCYRGVAPLPVERTNLQNTCIRAWNFEDIHHSSSIMALIPPRRLRLSPLRAELL